MVNFPASLDALANPTASTNRDDPGFELHTVISNLNDIAEAVEAKLGLGTDVPARNKALIGNGANATVWDATARRNRLVNGEMRIAQRTMPTADNSYCLDRWRLLMEAASSCTVTQETTDVPADGSGYAMKLAATATNNNKFGLYQMISQNEHHSLRGKTVSLSFKAKVSNTRIGSVRAHVMQSGSAADSQTADPVTTWGAEGVAITPSGTWAFATNGAGVFTPTTSWVTYRLEGIVLSSAMLNLSVLIYTDDKTTTSGDYLVITDVQLEEGTVCTDVDRVPSPLELARCQHFCYVEEPGGLSYPFAAHGFANATTTLNVFMRFPVTMRVAPTLTAAGAASDYSVADGVTATALSALPVIGVATPNAVRLDLAVASGLTQFRPYSMRGATTTAKLTFSAEL